MQARDTLAWACCAGVWGSVSVTVAPLSARFSRVACALALWELPPGRPGACSLVHSCTRSAQLSHLTSQTSPLLGFECKRWLLFAQAPKLNWLRLIHMAVAPDVAHDLWPCTRHITHCTLAVGCHFGSSPDADALSGALGHLLGASPSLRACCVTRAAETMLGHLLGASPLPEGEALQSFHSTHHLLQQAARLKVEKTRRDSRCAGL